MTTSNQTPNLRTMSREEMLAYGDRGHRGSIQVCQELIRRHRQATKWRFLTEGPDNVVPFRRIAEGKGEPA